MCTMGQQGRHPGERRAANRKAKGIFCLETDWWGLDDGTTVEPVLQLLATCAGYRAPYIHRNVGTREAFDHYIRKWTNKQFARYPILYLGFHGEQGLLNVGSRRGSAGQLHLDELAGLLEGRCKGRVIHFGSCETFAVHGRSINAFLRRTEALAVMGYRGSNDWVESAAFEVLLLGELQNWSLTVQGMRKLEQRVRERAGGLRKMLDFRMVIRKRAAQ
jgi:hypothetical protein